MNTLWWRKEFHRAADGGEGGSSAVADPSDATAQPADGSAAPVVDPPTDPATGAGGAPTDPVDPPAVDVKPDWRDRRLAQLTARLRAAEAEAANRPAPVADPAAAPTGPTAQELQHAVELRAQQMFEAQQFEAQCNAVATAGKKEFADFQQRINELTRVGDMQDPAFAGAYRNFISGAMEAGNAERILHHLGGDLNEAQRIIGLSPVKQGVELAKLALRLEPGKEGPGKVSGAPKPASPPSGRGGEDIRASDAARADNLDTGSWMKRREAEIKASREAKAARR